MKITASSLVMQIVASQVEQWRDTHPCTRRPHDPHAVHATGGAEQ